MPTAPLYNSAGERVGEYELPASLFGQDVRSDLIHLAVSRERWNRRQGDSKTLSRSEVRGGGRKPYRQKGTGRARQGSIRAPHYRHGGVVHGPQPHDYERRMPRKMRRAAFRSALSSRAADGAVRVVEELNVPEISTRHFVEWLSRLEPGATAVVVLAERDEQAFLSARNLRNVRVAVLPGLSTLDVMRGETLILTQAATAKLEELYAG